MIFIEDLIKLFEETNRKFLYDQGEYINSRVSERSICGQLMLYLHEEKKACYDSYIVDVEYNRNFGKKVKTIIDDEEQVMKITCDIILHSRGSNLEQDNLIAIEMKKSNRPQKEKNKDRYRLMLLTRDSFTGNAFSFDGTKLPDHVCRYKLGIFYEIDLKSRTVNVEYYKKGELLKKYTQEY